MSLLDRDLSPRLTLDVRGKARSIDLDEPELPEWVAKNFLQSGGYPYDEKLDRHDYEDTLGQLQAELVKLQFWQQRTGARILCLFEGRDAAGKGGAIKSITANLNPRSTRIVALPKPSDREQTQWYFQRYVAHLPAAGELVLFDRSWYNRAGVERVMGFCTPEQTSAFLREVPGFENALARDGIHIFKFWLAVGREAQLKRLHKRRHDARKIWKLSGMDIAAIEKWDDYAAARDAMFKATDTRHSPWTVVRMNDKRRGRLALIRHLLGQLDYDDKDGAIVGEPDPQLVMPADSFLAKRPAG
ncbi:MAG: polyphosphate kinase 2, partial [Parvularcula sp.]|nr:polyphosphate kinase 2 [Parvularcula sp.]